MFRKFAAVLGLLLLATVTACSSSEEITVNPDAIIIDVRTAAEYAEGHLEGSELLDLNNGAFTNAVAGGDLDPDAEYLLYCRSGNRSGIAMEFMEQAGFTNVQNLGSVAEASRATGIEIVY